MLVRNSKVLPRSFALALVLGAFAATGGVACSASDATEPDPGTSSFALSTGLVISQVYAGSATSGSVYTSDFIELFNRGTTEVNLNGLSVQYGSAANNFGSSAQNIVALPDVMLPAGKYFLIGRANGTGSGSTLPTLDATTTMDLAISNGKVAIASQTMSLACGATATPCTTGSNIIDMFGYGTSTSFETAAAPTGNATTSFQRANGGCTETDDNASDFVALAPVPRNGATAARDCSASPADGGTSDSGGTTEDGASTSDGSSGDDGAAPSDGGGDAILPSDGSSGDDASEGDASGSTDSGGGTDAGSGGLGTGIVISQVYAGGGNMGAPLNADFVELFNRSSQPVSLAGLSLQYGGGSRDFGQPTDAGNNDLVALPNVTLAPGRYFLVGMTAGSVGTALPTPDLTGAIAMGASNGKIALARVTTPLGCGGSSGRCPPTNVVDIVGYGTGTDFETATAPTLSNADAALRKGAGCIDTDDNSVDFVKGAPNPRNGATAAVDCSMVATDAGVPPRDGGTSADSGVRPDSGTTNDAGVRDAAADAARPADASTTSDAAARDSGSSAADAASDAASDIGSDVKGGGCSCRTEGSSTSENAGSAALTLVAAALVFTRLRRRRTA
ncbi:MAG: lamin tail domain-containing protein [Polyangiaceae bacterium]